MEMCGRLRTPATSFSGQRALGSRCGYFGEEKTLWPLPHIGAWFSCLLARGLFTEPTTLSLHMWKVYGLFLLFVTLQEYPTSRLRNTEAFLSCNVPAVSSPRNISVCHHSTFYRIFCVKGKLRSISVVMYLCISFFVVQVIFIFVYITNYLHLFTMFLSFKVLKT